MKRLVFCLFFLAFGFAEAQDPPRFVLDASIDASRLDLETWSRIVWPVLMQVMTPEKVPTEINVLWQLGGATASCGAGYITIGSYPQKQSNMNDLFYPAFTHEMAHVLSLCRQGGEAFFVEGYATAVTNLTYLKLAETFPQMTSPTALWLLAEFNQMPLQAAGGATDFYRNGYQGVTKYYNAAAPFEIIGFRLGGTLKPLDEAINLAKPKNRTEYLAIVDRVTGKIDGILPSTLFNQAPSSFTGGPDGTFFGIMALNTSREATLPSIIANAFVNPYALAVSFFSRQGQGEVITRNTGTVRYTVTNVSGSATLRSGTGVVTPSNPNVGDLLGPGLPDGGYKLSACVLKSDGNCDPELTDHNFFLCYSKPWTKDKVLIVANSGRPLRVVDAGGATSVEMLPDLLVLSNAIRDITVTDGVSTRVITPTPISRIVFFKDRDQPYLRNVVNSATFKDGPVVPGSIATLFTWGATQGDPEISQTNPLLTVSCGKRTQVLFTGSDRRTLPAPFFYCSQLQLNVQVPKELRGPTAWVQVQLGESLSNQVEVQVADTEPSIFLIDSATKTGAVIFADGPKAGQLVTSDNLAKPGDFLSVFATGLGETMPPLPTDGIAPPPPPPPSSERLAAAFTLYTTLRPVLASANGIPWKVLFSGLAPGFVGLYQVNIQVPDTLTPGIHPFTLAMEGTGGERRVSNEILLAVQ